jgi:hypothetical protein
VKKKRIPALIGGDWNVEIHKLHSLVSFETTYSMKYPFPKDHELGSRRIFADKYDSFLTIEYPSDKLVVLQDAYAWAHAPTTSFDHDPVTIDVIIRSGHHLNIEL